MRWKQQPGGCKIEGQSAGEDRRGDEKREEHESAQAKNVSTRGNYKVDKNCPLEQRQLCKGRGRKKKAGMQEMDSCRERNPQLKPSSPFSWHKKQPYFDT